MGLVQHNKNKTEAEALIVSIDNPDTIYFTTDTHTIVMNGNVYDRKQENTNKATAAVVELLLNSQKEVSEAIASISDNMSDLSQLINLLSSELIKIKDKINAFGQMSITTIGSLGLKTTNIVTTE